MNFTLADLLRVSEAFCLFAGVLLIPGYVLCRRGDLFGFRAHALPTRLALALVASIGLTPAIVCLLWRLSPVAVWTFFGVCAGALLWEKRPVFALPGRGFLIVAGAWCALSVVTLIDLQFGHRLYFPTVTYDYAIRTAFTSALTRHFPPYNPYFFPGHPVALRYHYFWFALCAVVQRLGGSALSPRQAMLAGTAWCGLGLLCLVPLYVRFFQGGTGYSVGRRSLLALGLLAVTGLDVVPVILIELSSRHILASIEWWNDPVTSWVNSVFWVPHHVAGLIACLTGFLLVWTAPARRFAASAFAAGVMFSGALGMSIYVTFVFALCLAVWLPFAYGRGLKRHAGLILAAGAVALACSVPYLRELFAPVVSATAAKAAQAGPAFPIHFAVKPFFGISNSLVNLALLPVNYAFELGFFAIVLVRGRRPLSNTNLCALVFTVTSLTVCTFLKSSVIANNDLGWRGIMIAQFILLLWVADYLLEHPQRSLITTAALALGVAGSAYELAKIRMFPILADVTTAARQYDWLPRDGRVGERTFALRSFYEDLKRRTPPGTIYQHDPVAVPQDNFHGLYADRQLAAETPSCATVFGGDPAGCQAALIHEIYQGRAGICQNLPVQVWIWPLPNAPFARAIRQSDICPR